MSDPANGSVHALLPPLRKTLTAPGAGLTLSGTVAAETQNVLDTTWLSLEELVGIEIRSAAKRP